MRAQPVSPYALMQGAPLLAALLMLFVASVACGALIGSPAAPTPAQADLPAPGVTRQPADPTPSVVIPVAGPSPAPQLAFIVGNPTQPFGDIAVAAPDGGGFRQLTTYGYNQDPVLSPDGERVAYRSIPASIAGQPDALARLGEGHFNIWVISSDGAQAWKLTEGEVVRGVPAWSPDSRRVAFAEGVDGVIVEVEVATGQRREITRGHAPRYHPAGDGLAYLTPAGGLAWLDGAGQTRALVPADGLPAQTRVEDFDWLPDGEHVAYTLADHSARIGTSTLGIVYSAWLKPADSGLAVKLADGVHDLRAAPDGRTLAAVQGSGYGDACHVDAQVAFLYLAADLGSAQLRTPADFQRPAATQTGEAFYPASNLRWATTTLAFARFGVTCAPEAADAAGVYVLDTAARTMTRIAD